jgi:hypothetical protein
VGKLKDFLTLKAQPILSALRLDDDEGYPLALLSKRVKCAIAAGFVYLLKSASPRVVDHIYYPTGGQTADPVGTRSRNITLM